MIDNNEIIWAVQAARKMNALLFEIANDKRVPQDIKAKIHEAKKKLTMNNFLL